MIPLVLDKEVIRYLLRLQEYIQSYNNEDKIEINMPGARLYDPRLLGRSNMIVKSLNGWFGKGLRKLVG
jgi:hypothetical protein